MIRELLRLQSAAVELAEERLPRLVERLRKGDDVDAVAETPELEVSETAEVDRVMRALSTVRRTAVEAAVGQATLRKGVGQVFLNLARRNQALLHRQLTLLDAMERRAERPGDTGGPVPARPPDHPHAAARGEPDHPVRRGPRPAAGATRCRCSTWCAPPSPRSRTTPGSRCSPMPQAPLLAGQRGRRRDPPDRRAGGERHRLLAAAHRGARPRRVGGQRLRASRSRTAASA